MRHSPSPKKGRRAKGSSLSAARGSSEDLKEEGSSTATASSESIKQEDANKGEVETEAIETAREELEGKSGAKARRKAHLGFLMGRTERRREKGKEGEYATEKETETENMNQRGRSMEKESGGKENERKRSKGRGRSHELQKERERSKDRGRKESGGMSVRAHIRALTNGVPIQAVAREERGGGDGNWVVWDRLEGKRVDEQVDGIRDAEGEAMLVGLGIAL